MHLIWYYAEIDNHTTETAKKAINIALVED